MRALQQQVNALMSQNGALEAQLVSQQNIAQGLAELPRAITTVLSLSQAPMRSMLVDPKGLGKPRQCSQAEKNISTCGPRRSRTMCLVFFQMRVELRRLQRNRKTWSQQQQLQVACLNSELRRLGRETDSSSWCCQPSPKVKASTLSCQQEVTMASRVGASCTEGGIRTQRDEHEVS